MLVKPITFNGFLRLWLRLALSSAIKSLLRDPDVNGCIERRSEMAGLGNAPNNHWKTSGWTNPLTWPQYYPKRLTIHFIHTSNSCLCPKCPLPFSYFQRTCCSILFYLVSFTRLVENVHLAYYRLENAKSHRPWSINTKASTYTVYREWGGGFKTVYRQKESRGILSLEAYILAQSLEDFHPVI